MAFANAKVLLLGEHAVVYGEPAIAAGLDLGVHAHARPGPWTLECEAWGLCASPHDGSRPGAALAALLEALPPVADTFHLTLDATVPPGAGLGSSAALAIASARAIAQATGQRWSDSQLYEAGMASERVFHATPSGLDHSVAIRGGLIQFIRGNPPQIQPLHAAEPLELLIAQVAPGGDTGALVQGVAARRERVPHATQATISAIGALVRQAEDAIRQGHLQLLGELMNINHGLLAALGVSTRELDLAVHTAREAGALGAKLTGAGGGGCMVALVDATTTAAVRTALERGGATVYAARVQTSTPTP